jgi:hypothetical protein
MDNMRIEALRDKNLKKYGSRSLTARQLRTIIRTALRKRIAALEMKRLRIPVTCSRPLSFHETTDFEKTLIVAVMAIKDNEVLDLSDESDIIDLFR